MEAGCLRERLLASPDVAAKRRRGVGLLRDGLLSERDGDGALGAVAVDLERHRLAGQLGSGVDFGRWRESRGGGAGESR